jgi:hypothetical protein
MFMWKSVGRCGTILVGVLALAGFAAARPQAADKQQNQTPAEAARKAREQKKADTKAAHVWDNDNIAAPANAIEVVGPDANAPAPDANAAAAAADQTAAATASGLSPQEAAHVMQAIKEAQDKIDELKKDINLNQRAYDLDAQMFYGKPDFKEDKDGQKSINGEKAALDDKKQQLRATQQMLAELQTKIGVSPAKVPETKPAPPPKPVPPGAIPLPGPPS